MAETTFTEVKDLVSQIGRGYEEFKTANDKNLKDRDTLLETKMSKLADDITKNHEKATNALAELEGKFNRPQFALAPDDVKLNAKHLRDLQLTGLAFKGKGSELSKATPELMAEYNKGFGEYIHWGDAGMDQDLRRKSMSVGSDPDGGYWIMPPEIDSNIRTRIFETSPIRQVATVQQISTHEFKVPEDPNEASAGWVGEQDARPETSTPKVATKVITAHEIYAQPKLTRLFLEDAAINAEAWIGDKVADKISRVSNTAFVSGNGVAKPRGFTTYPAGSNGDGTNKWGEIEQILSGATAAFAYDSLITLITSIKDPYQPNAAFLTRRQSLAGIMTLKDGASRYIFQPILNGSFNNTPLLGYPLHYASDMAANGTTGNIVAAFGDFKRGYLIVDRVGISVLRDELTQKGFVLFYTRMRVGGDVVDFDAIKLYKLS